MPRSRLLPWFFSGGLLLAAACSDSVAPTSDPTPAPAAPSQPALTTLTGSVHVTYEDLYPAVLTMSDGENVRLSGQAANMLVSVDKAEVEVHGQWESDANDFFVADFLVRAVNGSEVIDGTLVALTSTIIDTGEPVSYAIRPTSGGSDITLIDPSADLLTHVGQRVWIAGVSGGSGAPTAFGVITEM
jgi:hypothetical protein